jgi:hypothetical protein
MEIPLDDILAIVRSGGDPRKSFIALRELGRARLPSDLWDRLRTPDVESDIWNAGAWLMDCVAETKPSGVLFSLDTINEGGGDGFNIAISTYRNANQSVLSTISWEPVSHDGRHLIEGLYKVHKACERFDIGYPAKTLFYSLFFFGYGGVVLAMALERIPIRWECLYAWGVHDVYEELMWLARTSAGGVTRLAAVGEGA